MCEWSVCLRLMRITLAENKKFRYSWLHVFLFAFSSRFSMPKFMKIYVFFFFKVRLLKRSLRRVLSRKLSCPEKSSPGRFVVNMYVCVSKIRQNKSVMLVVVSRYVIVIFVSKVCCEWVSEWVFGANSIPKSVDCIYIYSVIVYLLFVSGIGQILWIVNGSSVVTMFVKWCVWMGHHFVVLWRILRFE